MTQLHESVWRIEQTIENEANIERVDKEAIKNACMIEWLDLEDDVENYSHRLSDDVLELIDKEEHKKVAETA